MDRISALIPPIKSENLPLPTPSSSESNQTAITNTPTINIPPPPFVTSVNELRSLSTALSTFLSRYDELNNHLNFIKSFIDANLPSHLIDDTVSPNQLPLTRLIESFCDQNVTVVTEAVGSEPNPNGTVSDCERSRENVSTHEGTNYLKKDEEIDSLNNGIVSDCERSRGNVSTHEGTNYLKKDEEIDSLNKHEEIDCLKKHGEIDVLKDCDEIDVSKDCDEIDVSIKLLEADTDVLKDSEAIDVSMKLLETDIMKIDKEIDESNNSEEIDVSKKLMETDTLKIDEETDVLNDSEDIDVSKKLLETNTWKIDEETNVSKMHEEINISMNSEEIDTLSQYEETDLSMDHEEIDILKKHEEIDTLKNNEEADFLQSANSSKKQEEIVVSRKPESSNSPKKNEETDLCKNHEEIDISKNPEEIDMEENDVSKKQEETNDSKKHDEINVSKKQEKTDNLKPKAIDVCKKHEEIDTLKKSADSELETLCARMVAKGMKKYVIKHIYNMNKLREELPKALKLAKDPAKLVLDNIGRFFLQPSKSYHNGRNHHEQIVSRLASVMILECFVMISSDGIEISKEDKAYAAEAAVRWKQRMIREGGVRHMEETDARGLLLLISGFGVRDRDFKIGDIRDLIMASNVKGISTALRRSIVLIPKVPEVIHMMVMNKLEIEAADTAYTFGLEDMCHPQIILTRFLHNKIKDIQNGSPFQVLMAMKRQLFDLKSVKICLESHKVEPSKLLTDFKINEKIQHLEKEINHLNLTLKRKSTERNLTPKRKSREPEFLENPIHDEAKRPCFSHENMPHGEKPVVYYPMNPYNRSAEPSSSYLDFDRGSYGTRVYSGTVDQMVHTANVRPYSWHGDPPFTDNYMGQPYSRQSQTYDSQPYGRSQLESFPEFPARRASDLYSFADTVVEQEFRGSHKAGNGTSHPSYMY